MAIGRAGGFCFDCSARLDSSRAPALPVSREDLELPGEFDELLGCEAIIDIKTGAIDVSAAVGSIGLGNVKIIKTTQDNVFL